MRIGIVSTYPPIECGIATYTQYLSQALEDKDNEIFIISQFGAKGNNVFGAYSTVSQSIASDIFEMATKVTPDILHIQHEYGLYGSPKGIQIIELIIRCRVAGLPVITTLHTVYEELTREEQIILRIIIQESDAIIVHEDFHRDTLWKYFGKNDKIYVIPHGVREVSPIPDAKKKLDVEGKKVILLCGYFRPSKRFDRIIRLFPEIAKKRDDVVLVMAGKSRRVEFAEYKKELFKLIDESPASEKIIVLTGQFPQYTFDTIISAADVVILPYEKGGQSGILAHCFAFNKPVVTSNLRAFRNWVEASGGGIIANTDEEFITGILKILEDEKFVEVLKKNIAYYVKERVSWRKVADQHIEIYNKLVIRPTKRCRYVYWKEI